MTKAAIITRLRKMLDQLEAIPDEFYDDCLPLIKARWINANDEADRVDLICGVTFPDDGISGG